MAGGGVTIYDTTLRDGMQQEGLSVSVDEKVRIALRLDELGLHFIEGGFPASNPKETPSSSAWSARRLRHAVLVAFGMTRRKGRGRRRRPRPARAGRRLHAGGHHRRQDLGPASAGRAAREPRREPAHDRRVGRLSRRPGQARASTTPSTSSTPGPTTPTTPCKTLRAAAEAGAELRLPVRHQRRHAAADAWQRVVAEVAARAAARRSACTATTTPTARWPTRSWRWPPAPSRCRAR